MDNIADILNPKELFTDLKDEIHNNKQQCENCEEFYQVPNKGFNGKYRFYLVMKSILEENQKDQKTMSDIEDNGIVKYLSADLKKDYMVTKKPSNNCNKVIIVPGEYISGKVFIFTFLKNYSFWKNNYANACSIFNEKSNNLLAIKNVEHSNKNKIEEDVKTIIDQVDAWLDSIFPNKSIQDYILKIISENLCDSVSRNSRHINLP